MEFVCYADWNQLPDSAHALFTQAEKDSVFFSRAWFENLTTAVLEEGQSILLACVVEQERVLAILPLSKSDDGEHWHSLRHLYTSLFTLLLAENGKQETLRCLVEGLSQLPLTSLRLDPVADNDRNVESLQEAMEASGYYCHRYFRFFNWIHRPQRQSFEDYMAARPARVRNTIARKQRKLERERGYDIRLSTNDDLQLAKADYNTVYQASWKANELFGSFVDGLADTLADQGWLRLAILYIQNKPAAAQYWFVAHGKASIFKLAYDKTWKQYSPGSILTSYLMQHVIDTEKVQEIDFLTGNDAYKRDWMSERRERWGLYCAKPLQAKNKTDRFIDSLKRWPYRLTHFAGDRRLPLNQQGMSANDFSMHINKEQKPADDRVNVTMSGKFLPYKSC